MLKPLYGLLLAGLLAAPVLFGQDPLCTGSQGSSGETFEDNGGAGTFSGTVTTYCGPLTSATPSVPWIGITSATGTFSIQFSVSPNTTGSSRSGSITAKFTNPGIESFTFSVTQYAKLTFASSSLPVGAVGYPYSAQFQVSGGSDDSRSFSIISGSLPPGLSLAGSTISGTPTGSGTTTSFTAQVSDIDPSSGNPFYATQGFEITINPRFTVSTTSLPGATVGVSYSASVSASGGFPPYGWSLISGALPSGLSLNSGTGAIGGIPGANSQGSYPITIQVSDERGETSNVPLTLNVAPTPIPLTITTSNLPSATAGVPYSATLAANGGTTPYAWSATGLPSWLSVSPAGQVSGTPPSGSAGSFGFTAKVLDASGHSASAPLSLQVNLPPPGPLSIVTTSPLPDGREGSVYNFGFVATGGKAPYEWSATGLPAFLNLAPSGSLTGIPSVGSAGPYSFTATVSDALGNKVSGTFGLKVDSLTSLGITTSLLPPATVGVPYSVAFAATGGTLPYAWSASGLPSWLSLSQAGQLSGTPPAGAPVSLSFTVSVGDSAGSKASGMFSLTVNPLKSTVLVTIIVASPLPQATENQPYTVTFSASGGTAPYTWTGVGVPYWANLSPAGVLSGTPPFGSAGATLLTVTATDSANNSQSTQVTLVVLSANGPTITTTSPLPNAAAGANYQITLSATGGTPPYQWSGSGIPAGLTLTSNGELSGTPTTQGVNTVTAQATDADHNVAFAALNLQVAPSAITIITPTPLPAGEVSVSYSTVFQSSGGTRPQSWSLVSGTIPPGTTLDSSGVLSGIPTQTGVFDFTVNVSDEGVADVEKTKAVKANVAGVAGASAPFEITVTPYVTPDLILSCGSLSFAAPSQGTASLQTCSVISTVYNSIPFSVSANVPWLSVSTGGITPGNLEIGANPAGLSDGAHAGTITVSSPGVTSKTIQVSFTTNAELEASGILQVSPSTLTLSSPGSPALNQTLFLQNLGQGNLPFTVATDVPWLVVSPQSGTLSGEGALTLQATILTPSLAPGAYLGHIEIDSPYGSFQIPASLLISGQTSNLGSRPRMILSRDGILLRARQGNGVSGPVPTTFEITGSASTTINYTVSQVGGEGWLTLVSDPQGTASSTVTGTVAFKATSAQLPKGAYYAILRVTAAEPFDSPLDFLVVLDVEDASTPATPDSYPSGLLFAAAAGTNPPTQMVAVYTSNDKPISYQVAIETESGGNWLSATPLAGFLATLTPAQLTVSVNTSNLTPGIYRGGVNVSISNLEVRTVNVTLIVPDLGSSSSSSSHAVSNPASSASATPAAASTCTPANLVLTETGLPGSFSTPAAWPSYIAVQLADDCGNPVFGGYVVANFSNGDPSLSLAANTATTALYSATWTPVNPVAQLTITMQASASGLKSATTQLAGGVTDTPYPILTQNGTVNNLYPQPGAPLAPDTIVSLYGSALAPSPMTATAPLPNALNGTSVVIGGELAPLYYVSGTQINAQLPADLSPDQQYPVLVLVSGAYSTPQSISINPATPGVERQTNGQVVAQHQDYTLVTPDSPAKPGEYLVIFLGGMGLTKPLVQAGVASPSSPLASVTVPATVTVGGEPAKVQFAGLTPGLVGYYQINFQVPTDAKAGSLQLDISQMGVASNSSLLVVGN